MDNIYIYGYSNIYGYYMVNIYGCPGPLISKNIVRNCLWSSPAEPCHHGQTGQLTTDFSNNAGRASRPKNISVIQGTGDVREVESSHNAKLRCHARYIGQIWVNQKANSMAQFLEITRICGWPNRVQGARVKVLTLLTTSSIATVTTNPPAFVTRGLRRCQTCSFICWERMVTDIGPMVVTYLGWNIFCFVGYPKFSISKSGLSLHFDWNVCIPMEKIWKASHFWVTKTDRRRPPKSRESNKFERENFGSFGHPTSRPFPNFTQSYHPKFTFSGPKIFRRFPIGRAKI